MSTSAPPATHPHPPHLRLSGEEKRLLAVPFPDSSEIRSPGAEKKLRVYASPAWKIQRYNYLNDEEDDSNRPVM